MARKSRQQQWTEAACYHVFNRGHNRQTVFHDDEDKPTLSPCCSAIELDYLLSCGRYVERNPLESKLVHKPWNYRWSCCRANVLGRTDTLLTESPLYDQLGSTPERRQALWQRFLLDDDPKEATIRQQDWVIGDADFLRQARQHKGPKAAPNRKAEAGPRPSRPMCRFAI